MSNAVLGGSLEWSESSRVLWRNLGSPDPIYGFLGSGFPGRGDKGRAGRQAGLFRCCAITGNGKLVDGIPCGDTILGRKAYFLKSLSVWCMHICIILYLLSHSLHSPFLKQPHLCLSFRLLMCQHCLSSVSLWTPNTNVNYPTSRLPQHYLQPRHSTNPNIELKNQSMWQATAHLLNDGCRGRCLVPEFFQGEDWLSWLSGIFKAGHQVLKTSEVRKTI